MDPYGSLLSLLEKEGGYPVSVLYYSTELKYELGLPRSSSLFHIPTISLTASDINGIRYPIQH